MWAPTGYQGSTCWTCRHAHTNACLELNHNLSSSFHVNTGEGLREVQQQYSGMSGRYLQFYFEAQKGF